MLQTTAISLTKRFGVGLPADRRSPPGPGRGRESRWCRAAVTLSLIAAGTNAAAASTSSGSVNISLSVAAHYRMALKTPEAGVRPEAQSARLCLATNSLLPTMPVALIWSRLETDGISRAEPASGEATTIVSCEVITEHLKQNSPTSASHRGGLLLISPE